MKARMIVPYGAYDQGEIVRGTMAEGLVEQGYAVEIKMADPAPEVKAVKMPEPKGKKK